MIEKNVYSKYKMIYSNLPLSFYHLFKWEPILFNKKWYFLILRSIEYGTAFVLECVLL